MMTQHLWKLDHGSAHSGVLEHARISAVALEVASNA